MPNIKMKKGNYKDRNAIYDVIYYCLNHDLRDYDVMYLPARNDCMNLAAGDRADEAKYMADFWGALLDVYNKNNGKRFNHFIIGLGYGNQDKICHYVNIIFITVLQYMQDKGFPGLIAYHVTLERYHHIHLMVGLTNIYGKSVYINAYTMAIYLNTQIPYLKMQVMEDN